MGSSPLSSNLSWTHSLQKLRQDLEPHPVSFSRLIRTSRGFWAHRRGRTVPWQWEMSASADRLMSIVPPVFDPSDSIAHGQDSYNGNRRPNRRFWTGGQAQFREGGGGRAPMSRAWFWSGCKSSTCMGIVDAYLSDAITREIFAGFSSPLASVTTTAARSATLSLLLRIQVSKLPRGGEVVPQKQLGKRRTSSRAARISSRLRSIVIVL